MLSVSQILQFVTFAAMQVKHTKTSPKLAFFCLAASEKSTAAIIKFNDPVKVIARGHKTNDFAICFDDTALKGLTR